MKVFARGRAEFEAIIVPFNSPLKPIFQKTSNDLIEAGIQDAIFKEWEGTGVPDGGGFEKQVLTPGQVILVFMAILAFISCSVLILCFEIGHKTWYNSKSKAKKVQSKKGNNGSLHDNYL